MQPIDAQLETLSTIWQQRATAGNNGQCLATVCNLESHLETLSNSQQQWATAGNRVQPIEAQLETLSNSWQQQAPAGNSVTTTGNHGQLQATE